MIIYVTNIVIKPVKLIKIALTVPSYALNDPPFSLLGPVDYELISKYVRFAI